MPALALLVLTITVLTAPQVQKDVVDGVRNYTKVDATVGCAGATDPRAMASIAARGYKAVLNLREEREDGAQIPESRAAAEAAGLHFIHLPFNGGKPDPLVVDAFVRIVSTTDEHHPLFINCGSANRVGALWLVKRLLVDRWEQERAIAEARAIGLTSDALEAFALDYVAKRRTS